MAQIRSAAVAARFPAGAMDPQHVASDEGAAKFSYRWNETAPLPEKDWCALNEWRHTLAVLQVLGEDAHGVAYGNLSQRRAGTRQFIITGTQTAGLVSLDERHFSEVLSFDLERHALECRGPVLPSSEALSHAAVYAGDRRVAACLHVHHEGLWHALFGKVPTTSREGGCGSLKMARDILQLFSDARDHGDDVRVIVMAGHPDGLLFIDETLVAAGLRLLEELQRLQTS
jgi:L-ribulose-5-phosphate 4-epimerase